MSAKTQLDPSLPHPSIGEDTRRADSKNRAWREASREPVAGEAWVMDEEDLLELSLLARQEGMAIRGREDKPERLNTRPLTIDSDEEPHHNGYCYKNGRRSANRPVKLYMASNNRLEKKNRGTEKNGTAYVCIRAPVIASTCLFQIAISTDRLC